MAKSAGGLRRWWRVAGLVAALAVTCLVAVGPASASNPAAQGLFELDSNAVEGVATGDDWQNVVGPSATGTTLPGNFVASTFTTDPAPLGIFDTAGSKDMNDLSLWRWTNGSVPDKDDISDAYAADYTSNGSQFVYFGIDRFINNGDSTLGLWFFRNNVTLNPNGTFAGTHQDGDLLVVIPAPASGSALASGQVYRWSGGSLTLVSNEFPCSDATVSLCAVGNPVAEAAPWPYIPKAGPSGVFPIGTLVEGGIDVDAVSGGQVCFKSFLAETRSSAAETATLKDFTLGTFDTCPDKTPPTITSANDGQTYVVNQPVSANYSCADTGGSGLASCIGSLANGAALDTSTVGQHSFTVNASDNAGNTSQKTVTYAVAYNFTGFSQPVDNQPFLNVAKAGQGIPVQFSLGGNQGLNIFAVGYPKLQQIPCGGGPSDVIEQTVAAGNSSLSYNALTGTYTYVWKTDKAWAGTCGVFSLGLSDGSSHDAFFQFK